MERLPPPRGRPRFLYRPGRHQALLALLALALQLGAATGVAYIAGFRAVALATHLFRPAWLLGVGGGLIASFVGYYFAYQEVFCSEGGPALSPTEMRAVVSAGFGGFLAHSGGALDHYVLRAAGADDREARVRVWALGGLEHGLLAIVGLLASLAVVVMGYRAPPPSVTWPWILAPLPGFLLAFHLAGRLGPGLEGRTGWRGRLGDFLAAISLIRRLFRRPSRWAALVGMELFWIGDGFAVWAALACFGYHMNGARLAVGLATGAVFTRRTGPLAGAGVLMLVLPLTLWYAGAPLSVALLGVALFRLVSVWGPMPVSFGALRSLRRIGEQPAAIEEEQRPQPEQAEPEKKRVIGIAAIAEAHVVPATADD